jgi:hypothetical protein
LENLGLLEADWDRLGQQTHRDIGNKLVKITVKTDDIYIILDRLNGKNSIINKKSLEIISRYIGDLLSGQNIIDHLTQDLEIPSSLIEYPNTKWRMVNFVLIYYATSDNKKDAQKLFGIIEFFTHPVMHDGDIKEHDKWVNKLNDILKYDDFYYANGKIVKIKNKIKTSADYIHEILNHFKNEYNKHKISGLPYEYCLGEVCLTPDYYSDEYSNSLKAVEALVEAGFIKEYKIEELNNENGSWAIAVCKIDENKIIESKQQPMSLKIIEMPELKIQGVGSQKEVDDITKINLSDNSISFDDDKAKIIIGKKECQLPAYKNEHYFCRAIFQHPVNEFVDWSIIFENMDKTLNSGNKKDSTKDKRSIQDAMYAINKRIKGVVNTDDDLFAWKDKSVKRNY